MSVPIFIEELGAVLLRVDDLQPWRRFAGRAVALSPLPLRPLLDEFPELVAVLCSHPVVQAAGLARVSSLLRHCVVGDADCAGELVEVPVEGVLVPLCWHHDNRHRDGQIPLRLAQIANQVADAVLDVIAGWSSVMPSQLTPAQVCWWATVFKVLDLMPQSFLRAACRIKPRAEERRWVGAGSRPTGEHESHFTRPLSGDPLDGLREMLRAKPAVRTIDPEPAALHLARPKLPRWESEAYLSFVRQLPCVVTGQREGVEAHHLIGHGEGKMGGKAHDLLTFPLSHDEHMTLHRIGWQAWEAKHGCQLNHVVMTLSKAAGLGVFG
ncbi:DUF968 domain-containing protein [Aeromonas diversa]|uniref:DUF968 domain-containing protein n=1 Tax=Aeromonas diversa TaxID=502790 RepID=UPI00346318E6